MNDMNRESALKKTIVKLSIALSAVLSVASPPLAMAKDSQAVSIPHDSGREIHTIPSAAAHLKLALYHQSLQGKGASIAKNSPVVLFIHGATVSAGMSVGYRINDYSWMDDIALSGRSAWALDFIGYGRSDRYSEMVSGNGNAPLGTAEEIVSDIDKAVDYIRKHEGVSKITLIATSRGAIPAGYYATKFKDKIERIVFNSPIVWRDSTPPQVIQALFGSKERPSQPYFDISSAQRLSMLIEDRPQNTEPQLEAAFIAQWPNALAGEGGTGAAKNNVATSIRVPGGFAVDIFDAWHGKYWKPQEIAAPTLIMRGDYDRVLTTAADAQWLYDNLPGSISKRYVLIDKGTHAMLFEKKRFELYREVQLFLDADYGQLKRACKSCDGRS